MKLNNISAWISADGQPLKEFQVEQSPQHHRITAWIPSESGMAFTVHWRDHSLERATGGYIYIDGSYAYGGLLQPHINCHAAVFGIYNTRTTLRPFQFSQVETTDNEALLHSTSANKIGEIKVAVWEVVVGHEEPPVYKEATGVGKVHERSKKGLLHGVKYGAMQTAPPQPNCVSAKKIALIAEFIFLYRPMDLLMANDIAPRPATNPHKRKASAQPEDAPHDSVQIDQDVKPQVKDKDAAAEIRELREKLAAAERRLEGGPPAKRVKQEPVDKRTKTNPGEFLDVIDLT
ncbi:hypothetical protein FISHEDRAFT_78096 [Fistulina hepatica ATCC 64428]|nr:hypothetical protein FISHEDRAFT_78096 [Fistulina hepatica ATCC 64428]